jgi:hypothetical protein
VIERGMSLGAMSRADRMTEGEQDSAMHSHSSDDRRLIELQPPRRNRYFHGKLLDAPHLALEQDYGRGSDAQLANLVFGAGVLCGLDVTAMASESEVGVRVSAGVAVDGWGRRIVVPDDVDILPLKVTDDSGELPGLDVPLPAQLVVRLCYREFQRELTPAVASDPGFEGNEGTEAGLWIESYRIDVRAGAVDPTGLAYTDGVLDLIRAGNLAGALAVLAQGVCLQPPEDPSIVLATLTVGDNGSLAVDALGARAVVPTNLMLMRMIACLAARIEECCAHPTPPP